MKRKRMSLKVFFTKLRRLRGQFKIAKGGLIRTMAEHNFGNVCRSLCPIEAVAELLGEPVEDSSLPLYRRTRTSIIKAADDFSGHSVERNRRTMLKTLNLPLTEV